MFFFLSSIFYVFINKIYNFITINLYTMQNNRKNVLEVFICCTDIFEFHRRLDDILIKHFIFDAGAVFSISLHG